MTKIPASFKHNGVAYTYTLQPIGMEEYPYVFHVINEQHTFQGQLVFYSFSDEWLYEPNQEIAAIMAEFVMLWYE